MLVKQLKALFNFDGDLSNNILRSGALAEKDISVEVQNQSSLGLGVYIAKIDEKAKESPDLYQLINDTALPQTWLVPKGHELCFVSFEDNTFQRGKCEVVVAVKEATSGAGQVTGGGGNGGGGNGGGGNDGGGGDNNNGGGGGNNNNDNHFGGGTGDINERPIITKQPELAKVGAVGTITVDYIKGDNIIWYIRDLLNPTAGWVVASELEGWNTKVLKFDINTHDYFEARAIVSNKKNATANTNSIKVMLAPRLTVNKLSAKITPNVNGVFEYKVTNGGSAKPEITSTTGVPVFVATVTSTAAGSSKVYTVTIPYNDTTNGQTYLFTVRNKGQVSSHTMTMPKMMKILDSSVTAPGNTSLRLEMQTGEVQPEIIRWLNVKQDGTPVSTLLSTKDTISNLTFPIENVTYFVQGVIEVSGFGVIDKTPIYNLNDILTPTLGVGKDIVVNDDFSQSITLQGAIGSPITFTNAGTGDKITSVDNTCLGGEITIELKPIDNRFPNGTKFNAVYDVPNQSKLTLTNDTWIYYDYPKAGLTQFPNIGVTKLVVTVPGYYESMTITVGSLTKKYGNKIDDVVALEITEPVEGTAITIDTKNGTKYATTKGKLIVRTPISYVTQIHQTVNADTISCSISNLTDNTPFLSYKWYLMEDPTAILSETATCTVSNDKDGKTIICETAVGDLANISIASAVLTSLEKPYFIRDLTYHVAAVNGDKVILTWQAGKWTNLYVEHRDNKVAKPTWRNYQTISTTSENKTSLEVSLDTYEDYSFRVRAYNSRTALTEYSREITINERAGISWVVDSGIKLSRTDIYTYSSKTSDYRDVFDIIFHLEGLQNAKYLEYNLLNKTGYDYTANIATTSNNSEIYFNGVETGNRSPVNGVYTQWVVSNTVNISPPYSVTNIDFIIPTIPSGYATNYYFTKMEQVIYGRGGEVSRKEYPIELALLKAPAPLPLQTNKPIQINSEVEYGGELVKNIHWQVSTDLTGVGGWTDRKDLDKLSLTLEYNDTNKNKYYRPVVATGTMKYYGYPIPVFDNADYPVKPHAIPVSILSTIGVDKVHFTPFYGTFTDKKVADSLQRFTKTKFYWCVGFDINDYRLSPEAYKSHLYSCSALPTWICNPDLIIAVTDTPAATFDIELLEKKFKNINYVGNGGRGGAYSHQHLNVIAQSGDKLHAIATFSKETILPNKEHLCYVPVLAKNVAQGATLDIGTMADVDADHPVYELHLAWWDKNTKITYPIKANEINSKYNILTLTNSSVYKPEFELRDVDLERPILVASKKYLEKFTHINHALNVYETETGSPKTYYISGYACSNPSTNFSMNPEWKKQQVKFGNIGEPLYSTPQRTYFLNLLGITTNFTLNKYDNYTHLVLAEGTIDAIAIQQFNTKYDWESDIFVTEFGLPIDFTDQVNNGKYKQYPDLTKASMQLKVNTFPRALPYSNFNGQNYNTLPTDAQPYSKTQDKWFTGWMYRIWVRDANTKKWSGRGTRYVDQFNNTNYFPATSAYMSYRNSSLHGSSTALPDEVDFPGFADEKVYILTDTSDKLDVSISNTSSIPDSVNITFTNTLDPDSNAEIRFTWYNLKTGNHGRILPAKLKHGVTHGLSLTDKGGFDNRELVVAYSVKNETGYPVPNVVIVK